ncbi:MAG: OmpA family protein [Rickettsiales bacterium]
MFKSALASLLVLCTLSACGTGDSLDQLRAATPTAPSRDAYQTALATVYRDEAESRAKAYEWDMSKFYADKGLKAAYGQDIQPEDPANWNIGESHMELYGSERARLIEAIGPNRATQPELAASGVLAYDKWLMLQHMKASEAHRTQQHVALNGIVSKLSEAYVATLPNAPTTTMPEPAPENIGAPQTSTALFYFPFDSDKLGASARGAVADLARQVKEAAKVTTVNINGHTDRVGSEEYNMDLSQRRAISVLHALEKAGVPNKQMHYFAFGESDPAVPTADGVEEPRNRRVEIFTE